ncbi:MAG: glucose 1-dehydrogenase [Rhodocyclaceae bacterium]
MEYSLERLFGVKGQVIVVTGASRGIGQELAIALGELGARVVATASSAESLADTRAAFAEKGLVGLFAPADVSREDEVTALAERAIESFGHIDGLVNMAGITHISSLFDFDLEDFRHVLDVNLMGTVVCCKIFGQHMVAQGGGRIVNISSVRGLQGKANYGAYAASKGAVNTFTKSLAVELAPHNVNVNAIAPIFTLTDINRASMADPKHREWVLSRIPKGRLCEKHELISPAVFLLSAGSQFVTGEILYVDGGWTAA